MLLQQLASSFRGAEDLSRQVPIIGCPALERRT